MQMANARVAIMDMVLLMEFVLLLRMFQSQILNQILIAPNGKNQSAIAVLKGHTSTTKEFVHLLVISAILGTN
jgi:hypothetical protein